MTAERTQTAEPGSSGKIDRLYAWLVTHPDGCEHLAMARISGVAWPMIGRGRDDVEYFRDAAREIQYPGCPVRLVCFAQSVEIERLSDA